MSDTTRDRVLEVLHASICNCDQGVPTGGYIVRAADALIVEGFGDATALTADADVTSRWQRGYAEMLDIAERAIAERDALAAKVAAVEALANEWAAYGPRFLFWTSYTKLRAALDGAGQEPT